MKAGTRWFGYVGVLGCCMIAAPNVAMGAAAPTISYEIDDKEEAFLVRRIAEFWKDQDFKIVRSQIQDFLERYPKSKINDHLRGILGDLYLQENDYKQALGYYSQVSTPDIVEKVILNKLQCYYELNRFDAIIQEGSPFLNKRTAEIEARGQEFQFLMGEAFFRTGLTLNEGPKRLEHLSKAEAFYEKIIDSSFNDPVMFALAEIYRLKKMHAKAALFFTELADRHPDEWENLLFHAALAQAEFDKKAAIESFSKIISRNSEKATDASINRLILYFQEERFEDVIASYPKISGLMKDQENTLDYIIGRSYFALENYPLASQFLDKYITTATSASPELRNALLMQLNAFQKQQQEDLYHKTMVSLQAHFPMDNELPQALFIHAIMLKDKKDFLKAEEELEYLLTRCPQFEDGESLYLEYSVVTHINERFAKSRATLLTFLKQYPESAHAATAWKYLLSNAFYLVKEIESGKATTYTKQHFFDDLTRVLEQPAILTATEKQECLFLQGKVAYELTFYTESLKQLKNYLMLYPDDISTAETHLLIALCHHKLGSEPEEFCRHAEAALKANPTLRENGSIHIELYNVYLSLIDHMEKKKEIAKNPEKHLLLQEMAAEHLYAAMQLKEITLKLDNKLWLANYYYNKVLAYPQVFETDGLIPAVDDAPLLSRSYKIFEGVLVRENSSHLIALRPESTYLEWEIMKFANLLGKEGKIDQKITLLRDLIEEQTKHPDWNWKLHKEALLELAKTYDQADQQDYAYETFAFLSSQGKKSASFVSEFATLHAVRLKFAQLKTTDKSMENPEVLKILNGLKEIQIRKNALSEPLHLEAAFEYARIRGELADQGEQASRYYFFLSRIKEDFFSLDDPIARSYHKTLKESSEKAALYDTYMQFLDGELLRTEALIQSGEGNSAEALILSRKAALILSELEAKKASYYLQGRASNSLSALAKSKLF